MDECGPLFERLGPPGAPTPLVCAVPHAGRFYPAMLAAPGTAPRSVLEGLEDRHADLLIERLIAGGAVAIVARAARAWIDLNRGPEDLDPDLRLPPGGIASARSRVGLGLIPRRIGRRELWRTPPDAADIAGRIATLHAPYHAAIAAAIAAAHARHGHAVLIDCHSMPPLPHDGARVVVGDRHGTTADPAVGSAIVAAAMRAGVSVARNAPYAGAYTIARHGNPGSGVHAVQLEIDRSLYLARDRLTPAEGLDAARRLVTELAIAALRAAGSTGHAATTAAE